MESGKNFWIAYQLIDLVKTLGPAQFRKKHLLGESGPERFRKELILNSIPTFESVRRLPAVSIFAKQRLFSLI
jgi:hypothetical protein